MTLSPLSEILVADCFLIVNGCDGSERGSASLAPVPREADAVTTLQNALNERGLEAVALAMRAPVLAGAAPANSCSGRDFLRK